MIPGHELPCARLGAGLAWIESSAQGIPAERVRAELERVLARAEFREQKSLLQQFLEWFLPKLGVHEVELFGEFVRWALLFGALTALYFVARRIVAAFRRREAVPEGAAPPLVSDLGARLAELAAQARAARASGDLRLALRYLFLALLLALGGRGDLEFRAAWTSRELLRRGKPNATARALLEGLVRELEPKEFGRASVSAADVERLEALLAPHLRRARRVA